MNRVTQILLNEQHHIAQSVLLRRVSSSMTMDSLNWFKRVGVWAKVFDKVTNEVRTSVHNVIFSQRNPGRWV